MINRNQDIKGSSGQSDNTSSLASRLFEECFLGTNISSVGRAIGQEYQVCQCCFDSGSPQGDCCPLY